jgi:hypothetical protein
MAKKEVLPWQSKALNLISEHLYNDHSKVTGEQVRMWLHRKRRLGQPTHSACYGALIRRAIEMKLLRPTKDFAPSTSPSSRSRVRRVYTVGKTRKKAV